MERMEVEEGTRVEIVQGGGTIGGWTNALCMAIPTPSKTARRQAHPIAEFRIDRGPARMCQCPQNTARGGRLPRMANEPPVKNPAIIALKVRGPASLKLGYVLPRIFFLSNTLDSTVICTKQTTPHSEIASQHRRTSFDCTHSSDRPHSLHPPSQPNQTPVTKDKRYTRGIPKPLNAMPY